MFSNKKILSGEIPNSNVIVFFTEKEIDNQGNNIFDAIGVSREEIKTILLANSSNQGTRAYLSGEIRRVFKAGEFIPKNSQLWQELCNNLAIKQENLKHKTMEIAKIIDTQFSENTLEISLRFIKENGSEEQNNIIIQLFSEMQQAEKQLNRYYEDETVYREYVTAYGDKLTLGHKSALIYAKIKKIPLRIWQCQDKINMLQIVEEYIMEHEQETSKLTPAVVDLLVDDKLKCRAVLIKVITPLNLQIIMQFSDLTNKYCLEEIFQIKDPKQQHGKAEKLLDLEKKFKEFFFNPKPMIAAPYEKNLNEKVTIKPLPKYTLSKNISHLPQNEWKNRVLEFLNTHKEAIKCLPSYIHFWWMKRGIENLSEANLQFREAGAINCYYYLCFRSEYNHIKKLNNYLYRYAIGQNQVVPILFNSLETYIKEKNLSTNKFYTAYLSKLLGFNNRQNLIFEYDQLDKKEILKLKNNQNNELLNKVEKITQQLENAEKKLLKAQQDLHEAAQEMINEKEKNKKLITQLQSTEETLELTEKKLKEAEEREKRLKEEVQKLNELLIKHQEQEKIPKYSDIGKQQTTDSSGQKMFNQKTAPVNLTGSINGNNIVSTKKPEKEICYIF